MRSLATRRVKPEHGTAPAWVVPKSAAELVDSLIEEALAWGASDVHLEPNEEGMQVRFRVHGFLQNVMTVPPRERAALVSRIKIMANLDIAEHRLPQDGRIRIRQNGHAVDARLHGAGQAPDDTRGPRLDPARDPVRDRHRGPRVRTSRLLVLTT